MKKIFFAIIFYIYSGYSFAVTSTITEGASTTLTYAPSISAGTNTNITSYSSSFKWIYVLHTFYVCTSGAYTASSTTTGVVNTTFFLTDTFLPTATFPPTTPISQFFVSNFSGGNTTTFTLNLTTGQQYSVLVAFNQTTAGSYPYTNTLTMDGPGKVVFNGSGTCSVPGSATILTW